MVMVTYLYTAHSPIRFMAINKIIINKINKILFLSPTAGRGIRTKSLNNYIKYSILLATPSTGQSRGSLLPTGQPSCVISEELPLHLCMKLVLFQLVNKLFLPPLS